MSLVHSTTTSSLLALPLELRLQIYNYVLEHSDSTATFSSAKLTGPHVDIVRRIHGQGQSPISEHLPDHHIPIVEPRYESSLLSKTQPAKVHVGSRIRCEELGRCEYSPVPAILLANKQIHAEIVRHLTETQREKLRKFSLFMSYPYGLHVFNKIGSHLLPSAQTVQIAGEYSNLSFSAARAAKVVEDMPIEDSLDTVQVVPTPDELAQLVAAALGPTPQIAQLQLRIYYPGSSSYSTVWGDDNSPTVVALRNIFAGNIEIEVWRGREGTGVNLIARPSSDHKRTVSTTWKKLNEGGRRGEQEPGTWIVDPAWPEVPVLHSLSDSDIVASEGRSIIMSMTGDEDPWPPAESAS